MPWQIPLTRIDCDYSEVDGQLLNRQTEGQNGDDVVAELQPLSLRDIYCHVTWRPPALEETNRYTRKIPMENCFLMEPTKITPVKILKTFLF